MKWKAKGIYALDSTKGQNILERATYTVKEIKANGSYLQADLFGRI